MPTLPRPARPAPCPVAQVEYVQGWGKLKSATEVEVSTAAGATSVISTKNIIIATGSEVTPLPGVPVDERQCVPLPAPHLPALPLPALPPPCQRGQGRMPHAPFAVPCCAAP